MSVADKFNNTAKDLGGKAKEAAGIALAFLTDHVPVTS